LNLQSLPQGIVLKPGELSVHFSTPMELIEKLMVLALAISEDWQEFESRAKD
jgi:hypothetical protein